MNNEKRTLTEADMEMIGTEFYKHSDDMATYVARSIERIMQRMDDAETRFYNRLSDIEDKILPMPANTRESLNTILNYLWEDECKNWEAAGKPEVHIYHDIKEVADYLDTIK